MIILYELTGIVCAEKDAIRMSDYMSALHPRFFRATAYKDQHREIELTRMELQTRLAKSERRTLLRLLYAESMMR